MQVDSEINHNGSVPYRLRLIDKGCAVLLFCFCPLSDVMTVIPGNESPLANQVYDGYRQTDG